MEKGKIKIISCGTGRESVTAESLNDILDSTTLIGAPRLIAMFPEYRGKTIGITSALKEVEAKIKDLTDKGGSCTILASGDSLFHGIASWILSRFENSDIEIKPNITAFQYLFSKLRLSWKNVQLFSLHKEQVIPWRRILNSSLPMIYCSPELNPAGIASLLISKYPKTSVRKAVIGQNLGMEDEVITEASLAECAEMESGRLSILLLLPPEVDDAVIDPGLTLGIPDEEFEHQNNLITHPEVRAVAISKLKLGPGIMWDIGAGSGSVGIEASQLMPSMQIYSVESDPERYSHIMANIKYFGSSNVTALNGNALAEIPNMPSPRSVFIGGGGKDIIDILNNSFEKLLPGGRIAAVAVTLETKAALANTLKEKCREVVSINISRSKSLGKTRLMKSENSVDIYVYEK